MESTPKIIKLGRRYLAEFLNTFLPEEKQHSIFRKIKREIIAKKFGYLCWKYDMSLDDLLALLKKERGH